MLAYSFPVGKKQTVSLVHENQCCAPETFACAAIVERGSDWKITERHRERQREIRFVHSASLAYEDGIEKRHIFCHSCLQDPSRNALCHHNLQANNVQMQIYNCGDLPAAMEWCEWPRLGIHCQLQSSTQDTGTADVVMQVPGWTVGRTQLL